MQRGEYAGGMIRRHVVAHGYVQGVGFRYEARAEASRLGVGGWVRNRADGTVEAEVEGDEAAVAAMLGWLAAGPRGAIVERTDVSEVEPTGERTFSVIA
jgi:acylphosphatase